MPDQRRRGLPPGPARTVLGALGLAVVLAVAFLLAPPLGTDLSAQVARANFFGRYGVAPLDLGWYAGVSPYGYSLFTPPLMHWLGEDALGPRLAGALALLVSAAALALLMVRTGARRPLLGGLVGAACVAGNLASGRITYAIGVAFGLLALLALTTTRPAPRRTAAGVVALLAGAASPVAGLFVGLAGVALAGAALAGAARSGGALAGRDEPAVVALRTGRGLSAQLGHGRRGVLDGATLAVGAGMPVAGLGLVFGAGGWMNISLADTITAGVASAVVAVLVPRRVVRIGAVLATLGVLAAFAIRTPVGLNATRLAAMFALPMLVAYGTLPAGPARRWSPSPRAAGVALAGVLALVAIVEPPVLVGDLRAAGDPTSSRSYFQPLLTELARRPPGRIEVVPTANYWEAAYVPEVAPLARGWLRQADQAYHRLFLDGSVAPDSYGRWLRDNGVAYVALAGAKPSWVGRREAELIRAGVPYLTPIWQHPDWTLYAVADAPSIVETLGSGGPPESGNLPDGAGDPDAGEQGAGRAGAVLVRATAAELTVDVPAGGETLVRLRWSRWLRVTGPFGPDGVPAEPPDPTATILPACLAPYGDWTVLRVPEAGRYRITSSLSGTGPRCAD